MSNRTTSLSLQQKVSVTMLLVMAALAVMIYGILRTVISPTFDQLELDTARTNLMRAANSIETDLDNLDAIARDWAFWDDAHAYALGQYPEFRRSNLDRPTLENLNLSMMLVYDTGGKMLWGELLYKDEGTDPLRLGVLDSTNAKTSRLIDHTELDGATRGLLRTELGPMLFSSLPILTSRDEGPVAGTMVMAQFLDDQRFENLRARTEVRIDRHELAVGVTSDYALPIALNSAGGASVQHQQTETTVLSRGLLLDLHGDPLMILEASTPRQITALGKNTLDAALAFMAATGIIVALVAGLLLRSIIVLPLEALANHITAIRASGDLTERLNQDRGDEIGALANEFDKMTAEVHDARQKLVAQSFKAGKADTAAEVLHNIRNAMTPLINGLDRLGKYFKVTETLKVGQATSELRDDENEAERRMKLIDYVESAFSHIKDTCNEAGESLGVISRQARQVEAILSDQEKHTNVAPVAENLALEDVLDEAVLVIPKTESPDVQVDREDAVSRYRVRAHRVGLLQVLGNVILNAYESIQRGDADSGQIRVTASSETVENQAMVKLTISDSGCGFSEQDSKKIFQRGFSSKNGDTSGLGLHWCANAVAAMGGNIRAESIGPGRGAEFHVVLPAA